MRLRRELQRHAIAVAAMFGVPVAVTAGAYALHVFDGRVESPVRFVLRASRELALRFLPAFGFRAPGATALVIVLAAGLTWLMTRRTVRGRLVVVPFVLLVLMVVVNVAAGLAGRYPYGGYLRHELFLFPLAVLCLFTGVELARRSLRGPWSAYGLWAAATAAGVAVSVWIAVSTFAVQPLPLWQTGMARFQKHVLKPPAVLADQFNYIFMFGEYHDWAWSPRWEDPKQTMWQVWDVSRGDAHFAVCRGRAWLSDLSQERFYQEAAACLRHAGVERVAVFRLQPGDSRAAWRIAEAPALARMLGPPAGLSVESMFVEGEDLYGLFAAAH